MHPERELDDRLRAHLRDEAATVPPIETSVGRITAAGRRRRRTQRALAGVGVLTALVAGGVGIVAWMGSGSDGQFAVEGGTTTLADDGVDVNSDTDVTAPAATDGGVPATTAGPAPASPSGESTAIAYPGGATVVPWDGGFLEVSAGGMQQIGPMSDELLELFSDEVRELFDEQPATIADALTVLNEHPELLAEVEQVIADNPAVHDAIYGQPFVSELSLRTSPDGRTWTPLPAMELPAGLDYTEWVDVHAGRVVVAASNPGAGPDDSPSIVIASTTDLVGWDTVQEIELDQAPSVDGFSTHVGLSSFDVGGAGVIMVASESTSFDPWPLLEDLHGDLSGSDGALGIGTSIGTDGVTLEITDADNVTTSYDYTWDELGVDPVVALETTMSQTVYTGSLDDDRLRPVDVDLAPAGAGGSLPPGVVAPTSGGFGLARSNEDGSVAVRWSDDGETWVDRSSVAITVSDGAWFGPSEVHLIETGGRVVLATRGADTMRGWSTDDAGATWQPVELLPPGEEGSQAYVSAVSGGADGAALVVSTYPATPVPEGLEDLVVERDGYRLTIGRTTTGAGAQLERLGDGDEGAELVRSWGEEELAGTVTDGVVEHDDGSVTFLDPTTEEPLVTFTAEDFDAAFAASSPDDDYSDAMTDWSPTHHVVASADGVTWSIVDQFSTDATSSWWPSSITFGAGRIVLVTHGDSGVVEYRTLDL